MFIDQVCETAGADLGEVIETDIKVLDMRHGGDKSEHLCRIAIIKGVP